MFGHVWRAIFSVNWKRYRRDKMGDKRHSTFPKALMETRQRSKGPRPRPRRNSKLFPIARDTERNNCNAMRRSANSIELSLVAQTNERLDVRRFDRLCVLQLHLRCAHRERDRLTDACFRVSRLFYLSQLQRLSL